MDNQPTNQPPPNDRALPERLRDIEAALGVTEARLRAILESALDCIITMNPDGIIEGVNAAAERTFGYTREQMIGKTLAETIIPPQLREAHWKGLRRWQETGEGPILGRRLELSAMKADGSEFPVEVAIVPTALPDRTIFTGFLRDITQRKHFESELRKVTETLEQRVAERTAEAERRTHQLRLLSAELTTTEERERRRLAEFLHDHLQQLLVAARMRLGSLESRLTDPPLAAAAREVQELLKEAIRESRSLTTELSPSILYEAGLGAGLSWLTRWLGQKHELAVETEIDPDAAPQRQEQAVMLFQITRELLFNVVKHSGVKQARVRLHRLPEGDIQLEVSDPGRGITVSPLGSARRGFGLFSIRERLELLGGRLELQSPPEGGTRVVVTLPAQPIAEALERSAQDPVRVLLVDDQRAIREAMAMLIDDAPDLEVVGQASNGAEVVELVRSTRPHVVLMDVSMPGLSGVDATRQIVAQFDPADCPKVIGLSIHEEHDMAHAMVAAGASEYLNKTVGAQELIWTIRRVARPESLRAEEE